MLSCGLISEMPLIVFALAKARILNSEMLKNSRPYAVVVIFVIAGILTPPEPISQIAMAIPLVFLYEISILIAKFAKK